MTHVMTLITDPAQGGLDDSTARLARTALRDLGAEAGAPDWLHEGIACDVAFSGLDADQAQAAVAKALAGQPVDVVAQVAEGRRKAVLVADMESTIIEQEMLDELGELVGARDKIAAITARAMNGEIDFKGALRERVALLSGLPGTVLADMMGRITLMPGAATLLATLKKHGTYCALVSGGFKPFTAHVRDRLAFDEDQANDLEVADGKLTGKPLEPILDKDAKLQALIRIAGSRRVPLVATMTVGDGANDLPMLQGAGTGVAFHAKPTVAAQARARVDHGDLTALLYIQGYRAAEMVAS
ncbi:phosphoserine phosphatase SerB [Aerophototrophica crusticola]|uniref:Phosphoserine phosphatase n=1 Tax=Aerophototrophica crusticola TaxID=1709002 RepID=A0A858R805_9PROT|nr:phosphoserine phosphatase SerB [Rhodospirillaceae bacterium B3]